MRFATLSSVLAFVAAVCAQSSSGPNPFNVDTSKGITITAGQPYTVKWTPTTQGTVSLQLRSGASNNLDQGTPIASSIQNSGSYTFTLPSSTTRNSDYTVEIISDSDKSQVNYTPQLTVESSNTVASMSSASGSSSASASSASSATSSGKSSATSSGSTSATSSGSMTTSASSSKSSSASATSSSASAKSASSSAAAAPTSGASNLRAQGGLAALMIGAAALL